MRSHSIANSVINPQQLSYDVSLTSISVNFSTKINVADYSTPNGNILKKSVNGSQVYSVRIGTNYLQFIDNYETLESKTGLPTSFTIKNDLIYLYPTPDNIYPVSVEYLTLAIGESDFGDAIYTLENDNDSINIPEKYETIFKNALITKSMLYAIASETDENYSGYNEQFAKAYKILLNYTAGINREKRVTW